MKKLQEEEKEIEISNFDTQVAYRFYKAYLPTVIAFIVILIMFVAINKEVQMKFSVSLSLGAMFFASLSIKSFNEYRRYKTNLKLITLILEALLVIIFIGLYFILIRMAY